MNSQESNKSGDKNINKAKDNHPESQGRRDMLKALVTVPVVGAMAYGIYKKQKFDKSQRDVSDVFSLSKESAKIAELQPGGELIRLGIIGCGIRGKQLLRALGFATPEYLQTRIDAAKKDKKDTRYKDFKEQ
ncbi:MAG TPA: oxidoreductase, partial [Dysgonomonas sp.]|nr:oxidoreductase [Dysgonomonas sp.]